MKTYTTIDEYLENFSGETRAKLEKIRNTIAGVMPGAEQTIRYAIPTFRLNGKNVIHFGGYTHHISLYPTSEPIQVFAKELKRYETSKGTILFPLNQEIPYDLIRRIAEYCVKIRS